ncbi:MAG: hypothetical protein K6G03_01985 [Lachnospiraceae bacterium]|nr:hypothetical protein [Lachnospiraceae bacterium]
MDNSMDRDNPFVDHDGLYDDSWMKPCTDEWRSIHPTDYNQYDNESPWGAWDSSDNDDRY